MAKHVCEFCGHEQGANKARSNPQLRRYHALIRQTFMHWPETHERQFANSEELRAYLQMKAGAREIGAQIPLVGMSKERAMLLAEAAIRGAKSYAMPVMHGDVLIIFRPTSISFAKMLHTDFCRLSNAVSDVIEAETGIKVEALLREQAA